MQLIIEKVNIYHHNWQKKTKNFYIK